MTFYFSATKNGFYDDALRGDYIAAGSWPDDAVAISDRCYQHLLKGNTEGKVITGDVNGQPVLSEPPAPTREQLVTQAAAKKATLISEAGDAILPLQDAVDLGMATKEEETRLLAWREYRVLLMRVDTSLAPDIEWPERPVQAGRLV